MIFFCLQTLSLEKKKKLNQIWSIVALLNDKSQMS